jgi:hypothetical protein
VSGGFSKDVFDAIPTPTFVVDAELRVVHLNAAARTFVRSRAGDRAGDLLGCAEATGGCGAGAGCAGACPLRRAAAAALGTRAVVRLRAVLRIEAGAGPGPVPLLVSAAPARRRAGLVVLNLEDVTELTALRALWSSVCTGGRARAPQRAAAVRA